MRVKIRLRDTDATGVLYFTEQMRLAMDVLEESFSLREMLDKEDFLLPVVHAESDYLAPLMVGDEVEVTPSVQKIGTKSFSLHYQFCKEGKKVGQVTITHVAVSKMDRNSIPIPQRVLHFLKTF